MAGPAAALADVRLLLQLLLLLLLLLHLGTAHSSGPGNGTAAHTAPLAKPMCSMTDSTQYANGSWRFASAPRECMASPSFRTCGPSEQLTFEPRQCRYETLGSDFADVLGDRDLVLIGDSLMGQLFAALRCSLQDARVHAPLSKIRYHSLRTSVDFGPTPSGWPFEPAGGNLDNFTHEFVGAFSGVRNGSIVLYNEGAWYTAVRFAKYNLTGREIDAMYARSIERVADYVAARFPALTFILRTTFPGHAGCHSSRPSIIEMQRTNFNWDRFLQRNAAAKAIAARAGWYVLDAYDALDQIPGLHPSFTDCVHWCSGTGNPLLSVVDLLYTLIKQLPAAGRDAAPRASATEPQRRAASADRKDIMT